VSEAISGKPSIPPFGLSTVTSPSDPMTYRSIQVLKKLGSAGTSFSILQATAQRAHPMHFCGSTPMA
jgi:hypothetical protein